MSISNLKSHISKGKKHENKSAFSEIWDLRYEMAREAQS